MMLGLVTSRLRSDRISPDDCGESLAREAHREVMDDSMDIVQTARVRNDFADAFRTLHESYLRAGLCEPQPSGMLIKPFHLWPETQVILCRDRGAIRGTLSLIVGECCRLPLEPLFPAEVARARAKHGLVAELSSLAISRERVGNVHRRFLTLTSFAVEFARSRGARMLLATVHPRHARFYQRAMGFDQIGNVVSHHGVGGKPATLIGVPIDRSENVSPPYRRLYFNSKYVRGELCPTSLVGSDRDYFAKWVVDTPAAVLA